MHKLQPQVKLRTKAQWSLLDRLLLHNVHEFTGPQVPSFHVLTSPVHRSRLLTTYKWWCLQYICPQLHSSTVRSPQCTLLTTYTWDHKSTTASKSTLNCLQHYAISPYALGSQVHRLKLTWVLFVKRWKPLTGVCKGSVNLCSFIVT